MKKTISVFLAVGLLLSLGGTAFAQDHSKNWDNGYVLGVTEVHTKPGFTPISGFPKMWEASGLTYPELCTELVELALSR